MRGNWKSVIVLFVGGDEATGETEEMSMNKNVILTGRLVFQSRSLPGVVEVDLSDDLSSDLSETMRDYRDSRSSSDRRVVVEITEVDSDRRTGGRDQLIHRGGKQYLIVDGVYGSGSWMRLIPSPSGTPVPFELPGDDETPEPDDEPSTPRQQDYLLSLIDRMTDWGWHDVTDDGTRLTEQMVLRMSKRESSGWISVLRDHLRR